MGIRCADHVTPLYPQKLALTSPTGGGRSVGIVRSRTKATEFFFFLFIIQYYYLQFPGEMFLNIARMFGWHADEDVLLPMDP